MGATLGNHDYYGGYDSIEAQLERTCFDKNWHMPSENYYYRDIEQGLILFTLILVKFIQNYIEKQNL